MATSQAISDCVDLPDRVLWFDGSSTYLADDLLELIEKYPVRYVDRITPAVEEYNSFVGTDEQIGVKLECGVLDTAWKLPEKYLKLDVTNYVLEKLVETAGDCDDVELEQRAQRCITELEMYEDRNLYPVLQAIIYVISTLTSHGQVWGVGRGSGVSSYVLYVIGVHDIDSFLYDLDISDFLSD